LQIVIGPEGGLTPSEIALLRASGDRPVRLGDSILRVETACVAAAAIWAAWRCGAGGSAPA
jgi:16S rRNA (uracil1498-N3)-methyltransferase